MKFLATVNGPIVSFNCLETGPYCVSVISFELALFKYEHFLSVISLSNSDLVIHQLKLFLFHSFMVMSCKTFNLAQIEWNYFQFPLTEQFIFMRLGPDTPCSFQEEIV